MQLGMRAELGNITISHVTVTAGGLSPRSWGKSVFLHSETNGGSGVPGFQMSRFTSVGSYFVGMAVSVTNYIPGVSG